MVELVSVGLTSLLVVIYIQLLKQKIRRYNSSQVNIIIDRAYKKWYLQYGFKINKKNMSMFEIDKAIHDLKIDIENKGIKKDEIAFYLDFLDKNKKTAFTLRDLIWTALGVLGTNSVISSLLSNLTISSLKSFFEAISSQFVKHREEVLIFLYLGSTVIVVILLVWVVYSLINIDYLYKDDHRLFILNRVKTIWDYEIDSSVKTLDEVIEFSRKGSNYIYKELEFSKTNFQKELDESIGTTVRDNFNFLTSFWRKIKVKLLKKWILGFLMPGSFLLAIVVMDYVVEQYSRFILFTFFISAISLFILVAFASFYLSQLDVYGVDVTSTNSDSNKLYKYNLVCTRRKWPAYISSISYLVVIVVLKFRWNLMTWPIFVVIILFVILGSFLSIQKSEVSP